jgi:hypothetical protein
MPIATVSAPFQKGSARTFGIGEEPSTLHKILNASKEKWRGEDRDIAGTVGLMTPRGLSLIRSAAFAQLKQIADPDHLLQ